MIEELRKELSVLTGRGKITYEVAKLEMEIKAKKLELREKKFKIMDNIASLMG